MLILLLIFQISKCIIYVENPINNLYENEVIALIKVENSFK